MYLFKNTNNSKADKPDSNNELNESLSIESETEATDYEEDKVKIDSNDSSIDSDDISMEVEEINFEEKSTEKISFDRVKLKKFDPTLDLSLIHI